jgi:hypothetical protein
MSNFMKVRSPVLNLIHTDRRTWQSSVENYFNFSVRTRRKKNNCDVTEHTSSVKPMFRFLCSHQYDVRWLSTDYKASYAKDITPHLRHSLKLVLKYLTRNKMAVLVVTKNAKHRFYWQPYNRTGRRNLRYTEQPNAYRRLKADFTIYEAHRLWVPVEIRLYNTHCDSFPALYILRNQFSSAVLEVTKAHVAEDWRWDGAGSVFWDGWVWAQSVYTG